MDNAKNKIEALIPEIKRNGEKLRLLERNLDAEKLKLRRKIRKDFPLIFHAEHLMMYTYSLIILMTILKGLTTH